jgi:hypothetical protein
MMCGLGLGRRLLKWNVGARVSTAKQYTLQMQMEGNLGTTKLMTVQVSWVRILSAPSCTSTAFGEDSGRAAAA